MKSVVLKGLTHRVQLKIFDFTTPDTPPAMKRKRPTFAVTVLPNSVKASTAFSRGSQVYYGDEGALALDACYKYELSLSKFPRKVQDFLLKWFLSGPKYQNTVVPLGGGWSDRNGGERLKEAIENAYLQAIQPHVRYVNISRRGKGRFEGVYHGVATIAAYNGRVFLARQGSSLSEFYWRGVIPTSPDVVEITGRYEVPTMYHI